MRRSLFPLVAAATIAVVLSACGSDDKPAAPSGTATDVVVTSSDRLTFDKDTYSANSGEVTIELENPGSLPHTLLIEGKSGFKLETTGDDTDTGTVDLQPGTYTIYCDVPGHRASGMEATLEIT